MSATSPSAFAAGVHAPHAKLLRYPVDPLRPNRGSTASSGRGRVPAPHAAEIYDGSEITVTPTKDRTARWQRYWDKKSRNYDREMKFFDRHLFGDSRTWACRQACGNVLEVAVGTGLNLESYPQDITLTGIDWSDAMLDIARSRATQFGRTATLQQADAHKLPFEEASFDTVVCTFGLCAIPDHTKAVSEMTRVLRPGGRLILVDHIESTSRVARAVQRALEVLTVPLGGEHFLRRPLNQVRASGLDIEQAQRFKLGLVERLVARKPG
jgi:ubiquinone/menaquinone biosynthesis C-methylase UbiE